MNRLLLILIWATSCVAYSQTTVHGYCTYYESEDSTATMHRYFSTETYDEGGENIYEKVFPLGNPDSMTNIDYSIGTTNNYIHENIIGTDTARYYYISDTINRRMYIIVGDDTSYIYETKYDNNLMVEKICLHGCTERDVIKYNDARLEDTILTIWEKGDTSYTIRVYDEKNRQILFKGFLDSPDEMSGMSLKTEYDDSLNIKTDYYGGYGMPGWDDNHSIEKTYYDEFNIPIKKELSFANRGKKEYFLIEYERE